VEAIYRDQPVISLAIALVTLAAGLSLVILLAMGRRFGWRLFRAADEASGKY